MKKIILILIVSMVVLSGCEKYTLNKIYGSYTLTTYTVDGVDSLGYLAKDQILRTEFFYDDVNSYDLFIIEGPLKDGGYLNLSWHWELQDKGKILQVIGPNASVRTLGVFGSGPVPRWKILRLTKKELKLQTTIDGHIHDVFLKEMN